MIGFLAYFIGGLFLFFGPPAEVMYGVAFILFGMLCHWRFWFGFLFGMWLGSKL